MDPLTLGLVGLLLVLALKSRSSVPTSNVAVDSAGRLANQQQGSTTLDTGTVTSQRPNTDAVYHILPYGLPIEGPDGGTIYTYDPVIDEPIDPSVPIIVDYGAPEPTDVTPDFAADYNADLVF